MVLLQVRPGLYVNAEKVVLVEDVEKSNYTVVKDTLNNVYVVQEPTLRRTILEWVSAKCLK